MFTSLVQQSTHPFSSFSIHISSLSHAKGNIERREEKDEKEWVLVVIFEQKFINLLEE